MTSERVRRQIDRMLDDVEEAAERRDWPLVLERSRMIFADDPENEDASAFATSRTCTRSSTA